MKYVLLNAKKFLLFIFSSVILMTMAACTPSNLEWQSSFSGKIQGQIPMFSSAGANSLSACTDRSVSLYKINDDGTYDNKVISTTKDIDGDGNYNLSRGGILDRVAIDPNSIKYILRADACGDTYDRPLTDFTGQNITYGPSLLSLIQKVDDPSKKKLNQLSVVDVKNLINILSTVSGSSVSALYDNLLLSTASRTQVESIVNFNLDKLKDIPPNVIQVIQPLSINEYAVNNFSVVNSSWYTNYSEITEWLVDGAPSGTGPTFSYIPTKNDQGPHTITLRIGQDDGSGFVNIAKPMTIKTVNVNVNNTFPPVVPVITLTSPSITNSLSTTLSLSTGVGLVNCATFSRLLITDNDSTAPTDPSDFTITCSQDPTQTINYTMGSGDGVHQLRVWAIDKTDHISAVPRMVSVTLEQNAPTITLDPVASLLRGSDSITLSVSATDAGSGVDQVEFDYAANGVLFSNLTTINSPSSDISTYAWTVPTANTAIAKIRARAKDIAGNWSAYVESLAFEIDSIAPSTPALTRTSPAITNNPSVNLSITCTTDYTKIIFKETVTAPTLADSGWEDCSANKNITVTGDGSHTIYAWTRDLAGNISTSSSVSMTLDTSAADVPIVTLTSLPNTNNSTMSFSLNSCTGFDKILFTESLVPPMAGDVAWANCSLTNTYIVSGEGVHTLYVWGKNAANTVAASAASISMILDTTAPVLSLTSMNSGAFRGGEIQNITWSATDSYFAATPIKLDYSIDNGASWVGIVTTTGNSGTYAWTLPSNINSALMLVRITAKDIATNSTFETSSANFSIDSTAPAALTLTRTSASPTKDAAVALTTTGCSGDAVSMLFKETSAAPTITDPAWEACAANKTYTVSTGDGNKNIYAFSKDAVGNISLVSTAATLVLDQTSPTLSFVTALNGMSLKAGSTKSISWTATDANFSTTPIRLDYSSDNGGTWNLINATLANSTYSWTVPSIDNNQIKLRITATDSVGNPATVITSGSFSIDSVAPVLQSVSINDGATYAGSTVINVKVNITDNLSTVGSMVRMKFATGGLAGNCQSDYADDSWQTWSSSTYNYNMTLAPVDGTKKVCVWAKDAAGNISVISPAVCTDGIDCNHIKLEIGNPPKITNFNVVNTADGSLSAGIGAGLTISWNLTDVEGLDNNPIAISYTTDNINWKDIITNGNTNTSSNVTWLGSLSGNPTSTSGSTTTFSSPSSSYFKLRAVARDFAGNYSVVGNSQPLNTSNTTTGTWSVYAGTIHRGDGGNGTTAALYSTVPGRVFTINPVTNDIYASDETYSIRKLDIKTGKVSTFIINGSINLTGDSGTLPAQISAPMNSFARVFFDKNNKMYLTVNSLGYSMTIYQLDLVNNTYIRYAGGGTGNDDTATALTSFLWIHDVAMDEDNSMYYFTDCNTSIVQYNTPKKLMKLTQNLDGTPGTISTLAGNCQNGTLTFGGPAVTSKIGPSVAPPTVSQYTTLSSIVPINHGAVIYLWIHGTVPMKIVNGNLYSANLSNSGNPGLTYNPFDQKIYAGTGNLTRFSPVLTETNGGEISEVVVTTSGTGACVADGVDASAACIATNSKPAFDSSGSVYFADASQINASGSYRIRYIDSNQKIRTIFGSLGFYGDGLAKELIRGPISGIYYKKASEDNSVAFPEGLYLSATAMVFGYINPTTGTYTTLFGNQQGNGNAGTNVTMSSDLTMGAPYAGIAGGPLTFDSMGLPWLRVGPSYLYKVDANKKLQRLSTSTVNFDSAADGADPRTLSLYVYGGQQNFALKGQALFLQGGYASTGINPTPQIRLFDFTNNTAPILMGKGYVLSDGKGSSPNVAAGLVKTTYLRSTCYNSSCNIQYSASEDRLYFTEWSNQIRYITKPDDTTLSTLNTLPFTAVSTISNFIFKEDHSQIFYTTASGLYCYDIGATGKSWCNNSLNLFPYSGAGQMGAIARGPNQMTWKDSNTLLISNYRGEILQFVLPP